ncbi:MAG TPA: heavy-metal-associated domain-containing protein [Gemmatimonadales bacterium]|nr:heavy-metal-associated domain-containing protein [Gemmatimonadales bacterium]
MGSSYTEWTLWGVHAFQWLFGAAVILGAGALFVPMDLWRRLRRRLGRTRGTKPEACRSEVTMDIHALLWVADPAEVQRRLLGIPGVEDVVMNAATATAVVRFDPAKLATADLAHFVEACAHHCWGERAPGHVCPGSTPGPAGTPEEA